MRGVVVRRRPEKGGGVLRILDALEKSGFIRRYTAFFFRSACQKWMFSAPKQNRARLQKRRMVMKTKSQSSCLLGLGGMVLFGGVAYAAGPGRPASSGPVKPAWTKPLAPAWQPAPPPPRQHVHRRLPRPPRPPRPPHPAPPPPPYTEVSIEAPQPVAQPIGVQPPQPPAPLTIHYDFR